MTRLVEIDDAAACTPALSVKVGDLLVFAASGGRADTSSKAVHLLGVYVRAVVGTNGIVVTPIGPPNTVVFLAKHRGQATIDVIGGEPFGTAIVTELTVIVED
jgi:hypothetical protein